MRNPTLLIVALTALLSAKTALAFKIETHLWLADQIYSEIAQTNGQNRPKGLRIAGVDYQINNELRAAILQHRGAFLMGVLGADVYPDMIAGQMTMHPGVNKKVEGRLSWQTDDWVNHVIRSAENEEGPARGPALAFAAGYALHPAMDLWAHTYVNLYSGDEFSMTENTEAAERHVALENYLTKFHRTVLDIHPAGRRTDYLTNLRVPASFVRKTLILNDRAGRQYQQEPTTLYLAAIHAQYTFLLNVQQRVNALNTFLAQEINRLPTLIDAYNKALNHRNLTRQILQGHLDILEAQGRKVGLGVANAAINTLNNLGQEELAETAGNVVGWLDDTAITMINNLEDATDALEDAIDAFGYNVAGTFDPQAILTRLQGAVGRFPEQVLMDWRRDIERAMDEYVKAWELTAKEIMRPSGKRFTPGADPRGPILRWAQCWAPTLSTPLGNQGISNTCENVLQNYSNARERFQTMKLDLLQRLPGGSAVMAQWEEIDAFVKNQLSSSIAGVANSLDAVFPATGIDGAGFANLAVRLWDKDVDAGDLDASYGNSGRSAGEAYVTAPVSRYVNRELQVCRGMPQPARRYSDFPIADFAPIQNAVTLSKLTLLSSGGLNTLIRDLRQRYATANPQSPQGSMASTSAKAISSGQATQAASTRPGTAVTAGGPALQGKRAPQGISAPQSQRAPQGTSISQGQAASKGKTTPQLQSTPQRASGRTVQSPSNPTKAQQRLPQQTARLPQGTLPSTPRTRSAPTPFAAAAGAPQNVAKQGSLTAMVQQWSIENYYTSARMFGAVLLGAIRSIDGDHGWQPVAPPLPRTAPGPNDTFAARCRRFGHSPTGYGVHGCGPEEGSPSFYPGLPRTGFVLYRPELRTSVFNVLFDPVDREVCNYVGNYELPGLSCATTSTEEFPAYVPGGIQVQKRPAVPGMAQRTGGPTARRVPDSSSAPAEGSQPAPINYLAGSFTGFNASLSTPNLTNAYLLSLLSYVSYPGVPHRSGAVTNRTLQQQFQQWEGIDFRAYASVQTQGKNSGSTQVLAATTDDALIIAFRGSTIGASDLGQDWWDNDLDFTPRPVPQWGRDVVMHDGFYDAAALTFNQVNGWIKQFAGNRRVIFTGHSLGGAIAFITAYELTQRAQRARQQPRAFSVHSFGAPPVGNAAWAAAYDQALPDTHRWSADRDPVALVLAQLPGPFRHVGRRHTLLSGGSIRLDAPAEAQYPLQVGPVAIAKDLVTTHNDYWCRLRAQLPSSAAAAVPAPPRSLCELCSG